MPQINTNNKTFYSIVGGKITRKVDSNTQGSVQRVNKSGDTINELIYDSMDGIITSININDGSFGKQLSININEDGVMGTLNFGLNSSYGKTFACRIENVNPEKKVKVMPYQFEDENQKKKTGIVMYQDGQKVQPNITKDTPFPNNPVFPDMKDKVAKAEYEVKMEVVLIEHIDKVKTKFKGEIPINNVAESLTPDGGFTVGGDDTEVPF